MIPEVDQALRELLRRDALPGSDVDVVLEAPTTDWASRRSAPVVNLYLYDLREDTKRRDVMVEPVFGEDGRVTGRRPPPRKFQLSYLLTVWTQRPEDEHRLLASCLGALLRYETVPSDLLPSAPTGLSALLTVGVPPQGDRAISDIWSALGGELKPSLDVRVTAPFYVERTLPAGPPVLEPLSLTAVGPDGEKRPRTRPRARPGSPAAARDRRRSASLEEVLHGASGRPVATASRDVAVEPGQPGRGAAKAAGEVGEDVVVDAVPDGLPDTPGRWFRVRDVGR